MVIENISALKDEAIKSSGEVLKQVLLNLFDRLKPLLYIILALLILYIIYKLAKFFLRWKKARQEKLTLLNTEKLLEIVERIEKKIDNFVKKPEKEERTKQEKKKKSK